MVPNVPVSDMGFSQPNRVPHPEQSEGWDTTKFRHLNVILSGAKGLQSPRAARKTNMSDQRKRTQQPARERVCLDGKS
jgi:hypothetical protein